MAKKVTAASTYDRFLNTEERGKWKSFHITEIILHVFNFIFVIINLNVYFYHTLSNSYHIL